MTSKEFDIVKEMIYAAWNRNEKLLHILILKLGIKQRVDKIKS